MSDRRTLRLHLHGGELLLPVRDASQEPKPRSEEVLRHQGEEHMAVMWP